VENEHLRDFAAARECFSKSKLATDFLPEIESKNEEMMAKKLERLAMRH
jgi:hypothetical protein